MIYNTKVSLGSRESRVSEWEKVRLKSLIHDSTNGVWGQDPAEGEGVVCVRVADFDYDNISVSNTNLTLRHIDESDFDKRHLKIGDLLLEKSGGGEKQLVGRLVKYDLQYKSVCSNFVARVRLQSHVDGDFCKYLFNSLYSKRLNLKHIKQSTGIQNLDSASYFNEKVNLPPLPTQTRIANFLDEKTALIDKAIAQKQRLIELLEERRQTLIHQAVTRGLDPNVELHDSGVDWIGKVPKHWEVKKLKHVTRVQNGSTPSRSVESYWTGGNIPWLNSSVVNLDAVTESDQFVTQRAVRECHLPYTKPGDILMAITGQGKTRGMTTICKIRATINQHLACLSIDNSIISTQYAHLALSAAYRFLRSESEGAGSTKGALTLDTIGSFSISLPTLDQQKCIVSEVAVIQDRISLMTSKLILSTDKLKEYKSTLINSAVTGQIEM